METEILVAFIVLIGGGLTTLVNYSINKRNTSGSVTTSDAASLWAESNALRAEYKYRAEKLETQLEEVNSRLQTMQDELSEVLTELAKARSNSDVLTRKVEELKAIIEDLREENKRLLFMKQS